jgi:hypothetical protein
MKNHKNRVIKIYSTDPLGRNVYIYEDRWEHITAHPDTSEERLTSTLQDPDTIHVSSQGDHRNVYHKKLAGMIKSKMRVITEHSSDVDWVVTAFPAETEGESINAKKILYIKSKL